MQLDDYIFDQEATDRQNKQKSKKSYKDQTRNKDIQSFDNIIRERNYTSHYQNNATKYTSNQHSQVESNSNSRKPKQNQKIMAQSRNSISQYDQQRIGKQKSEIQSNNQLTDKKHNKSNLQQFFQTANKRVSRPEDLYEQVQYSGERVKLQYSDDDMMIDQNQDDDIFVKTEQVSRRMQAEVPKQQKNKKESYKQIRLQSIAQEKQNDNNSQEQDDRKDGKKTSSLSDVTQQFIKLLKRSPNMTVCLNEAMKVLNLKKRRLYDISNVLQGIGYVKKSARNHVKWIGGGQDPIKAMQIHFLKIYEKKQADREREVKNEKQMLRMQLKQLVQRRAACMQSQQLRISQQKLQAVRKAHGQNYIAVVFPMKEGQQFYFFDQKEDNSFNRVVFQLKRSPQSHQYFYVLKPGQNLKKCNKISDIV